MRTVEKAEEGNRVGGEKMVIGEEAVDCLDLVCKNKSAIGMENGLAFTVHVTGNDSVCFQYPTDYREVSFYYQLNYPKSMTSTMGLVFTESGRIDTAPST